MNTLISSLNIHPISNPTKLERYFNTLDKKIYIGWFANQQKEFNKLILENSKIYAIKNSIMPSGLLYSGRSYYIAGNNGMAVIPQNEIILDEIGYLMAKCNEVNIERSLASGYISAAHLLAKTDGDMLAILDQKIVNNIFPGYFKDTAVTLTDSEIKKFTQQTRPYLDAILKQLTRNLLRDN